MLLMLTTAIDPKIYGLPTVDHTQNGERLLRLVLFPWLCGRYLVNNLVWGCYNWDLAQELLPSNVFYPREQFTVSLLSGGPHSGTSTGHPTG